MRIIIATIKSWNIERAKLLQKKYAGIHEIIIYTEKSDHAELELCCFSYDRFAVWQRRKPIAKSDCQRT